MALENSSTCELFRNVEQAHAMGRDLVEELRVELESRVARAYGDIADAACAWSVTWQPTTANGAAESPPARRVRWRGSSIRTPTSRCALGARRVGHGARFQGRPRDGGAHRSLGRRRADTLAPRAHDLRGGPKPFPLAGLESYEHIAQRIAYLEEEYAAEGENLRPLEEALVELDGILQFGGEVGVGARRLCRTALHRH